MCSAVRAGFIHLAEALAYRRDTEVPLRAVMGMLKTRERCNADAELIGKGIYRVENKTEDSSPLMFKIFQITRRIRF